jgi:predicted nucleic acid-binding protein
MRTPSAKGVRQDEHDMAFLARHTLSDCLYLAAAKRLGIAVVTADRPMRERGPRVYGKITLLEGIENN